MSRTNMIQHIAGRANMLPRALFISLASISAFVLFAAVSVVVMAFTLWSDLDGLNKRTRTVGRLQTSVRADIEELRRGLGAAKADSVHVTERKPVAGENRPAPALIAAAPGRFMRANLFAPRECEFHPGDSEGLMECIRHQQKEIPNAGRRSYR